jgi:proline iminopeptidase
MPAMTIRDVSLYVKTMGSGYPLVLMHGGPGADHTTMLPFRSLADRFTLVFYDHRCNGRSEGAPVSTMTWENLTSDAGALRDELGFERWAVLGHSFGGQVALEYALAYPERISHLILLDGGGDAWWARENAAQLLARRGYDDKKVELVRRWFNGDFEPREMLPIFMRIGDVYSYRKGLPALFGALRSGLQGGWRWKPRPEALIFAGTQMARGWSVMDRLGEIQAPTLVMAGRDDFVFPPEHQAQLAAGIPNARLHIVERAGHNPHFEQTSEVMEAVRDFVTADSGVTSA